MRRLGPRRLWGTLTGVVVGVELYTIYNEADGDTLSEVVRPWAQRHPVLFTVGCVVVPTWFWLHIRDENSVWCLDKRR